MPAAQNTTLAGALHRYASPFATPHSMYATQAQTGVYERRSANVNANVRSCNPFYRAAHGTGAVHFRAAEPRRSELRRAAPCPALSSTNEHRDGCTARLPDIQWGRQREHVWLRFTPAVLMSWHAEPAVSAQLSLRQHPFCLVIDRPEGTPSEEAVPSPFDCSPVQRRCFAAGCPPSHE